ncbi:lytic murein transglycosylase [Nocardioides sp.]|uniref:lytic transglycosylase domain-containing protein n=1 Tax=Nocardioides sp. TaxID=35761 RepID=UPI0031FE6ECE|nr:Membrane-bound lytic murein transglycosylase B-like protein [Nocardioides sp.]
MRSARLFGVWVILLTLVAGVAGAVVLMGRNPAPISRYDAVQLASATPVRAAPASRGSAARSAVDPAWIARVAHATGIPPAAVRAYGAATLRLADEQRQCRIGWTTLAGIGRIESGHGTIGGRTLLDDGRSSTPILGPALDGAGDFAAIPASAAATALHGDPRWDHAVGPLQFLPSTWARWGADGDGDGLADPHDLDDAAYAAGRYLCASGADLTTPSGWHAAVFSYNHAESYVELVYATASDYATAAG